MLELVEGKITPVLWKGGNMRIKLDFIFNSDISAIGLSWGIILVIVLIWNTVINYFVKVLSSFGLVDSKVSPVLWECSGSLVKLDCRVSSQDLRGVSFNWSILLI